MVAVDHGRCDIADADSVRQLVREHRPGLIVNAAAYTAVDQAEEEPERALAVNATAPGILAEEARRLKAMLVHYSTDYIFDGVQTGPYTEIDPPNPLNSYGRSKLAGEQAIAASGVAHLILRTGWVYGSRGRNFLLTMRRLASEREELKVVNDQIGAPTWSRLVAEATAQALARLIDPSGGFPEVRSGIYHLTAAGETSWHGFAKMIFELTQAKTRLLAIPSSAHPVVARRPRNSRLSNEKFATAFGLRLPDWEQGLKLCIAELAQNRNQD
jgi:dTDP-4-dehydrorhamnose reductase